MFSLVIKTHEIHVIITSSTIFQSNLEVLLYRTICTIIFMFFPGYRHNVTLVSGHLTKQSNKQTKKKHKKQISILLSMVLLNFLYLMFSHSSKSLTYNLQKRWDWMIAIYTPHNLQFCHSSLACATFTCVPHISNPAWTHVPNPNTTRKWQCSTSTMSSVHFENEALCSISCLYASHSASNPKVPTLKSIVILTFRVSPNNVRMQMRNLNEVQEKLKMLTSWQSIFQMSSLKKFSLCYWK